MANAICTACGKGQNWAATRGARLADVRCRACGGELRATGADKPRPRGYRMERCEHCGERRRSTALVTLPRAILFWPGTTRAEGARVCAWHEVKLPDGSLESLGRHLRTLAQPFGGIP